MRDSPVQVAVIGGGCAAMTAAFELSRPEHQGRYQITVYQLGWRLGGKGASGRGPSGRIEEHGLHVWLGFYENAFALMREAYAELARDPKTCPIATVQDAFFPAAHVGIVDKVGGDWQEWMVHFPPAPGLPGEPFGPDNPFTLKNYFIRTVILVRSLMFDVHTRAGLEEAPAPTLIARISRLLGAGALTAAAGLSEALALLSGALRLLPVFPETLLGRLVDEIAKAIRAEAGKLVDLDPHLRRKWDVIDVALALMVGMVRFKLMTDPRGLEAIDEYDCRDFLRMHGASERALHSGFVSGLYDLAFAHENGDPAKSGLAAGQAFRGSMRMFFTYRGSFFWKMRSGMGDIVFAPIYEVLKRRGVRFEFFHRLENIKLSAGERPYVEALEFAVQAKVAKGEYNPLVDVKGVPCWPSEPDWRQLVKGAKLKAQHRRFESHWDDRREATKTLQVTQDFDAVVLGVSVGAIPFVASEIVARDPRWRDMVANVKTVATQAMQLWLDRDRTELGWNRPAITITGFVKPFDTWADMSYLASEEDWRVAPRSIAYFCNVLDEQGHKPDQPGYEEAMRRIVRDNSLRFMKHDLRRFWPKAAGDGEFRFDWLMDPHGGAETGEARFDSQYWTANVNPTDRYVLALPGTLKYRISPLDNTYDNLTLTGDWTDCGYNSGCVEAAVMSGRLAAHAISGAPRLEDIIGYDHP